jgi:hypothetical protein
MIVPGRATWSNWRRAAAGSRSPWPHQGAWQPAHRLMLRNGAVRSALAEFAPDLIEWTL